MNKQAKVILKIKTEYNTSFSCRASPEQAFKLLSDVPSSASHVPNVTSLIKEGDSYHWKMGAVKLKNLSAELEYACQYYSDPSNFTVTWKPVQNVGNGKVKGKWVIKPDKNGGSTVYLYSELEITLNFPSLLIKPIEIFVSKQNVNHTVQYV